MESRKDCKLLNRVPVVQMDPAPKRISTRPGSSLTVWTRCVVVSMKTRRVEIRMAKTVNSKETNRTDSNRVSEDSNRDNSLGNKVSKDKKANRDNKANKANKVSAVSRDNRADNSKVVSNRLADHRTVVSQLAIDNVTAVHSGVHKVATGAIIDNCLLKFVNVYARHRISDASGVAQAPAQLDNSMK